MQRQGDLRRVYGHQQAFVFGFAIGVLCVGLAQLLLAPVGGPEDQLSEGWRLVYRLSYVLGGGMIALGIYRPSARLEAGGHVLVSALFFAALALTLALSPPFDQAVGSFAFIAPLAAGSLLRAYFLVADATHG